MDCFDIFIYLLGNKVYNLHYFEHHFQHIFFLFPFFCIILAVMRKKQITSPTKITVKQSPIIAKFGPQEVIVSDTSLKIIEDNEQSANGNSLRWQKNNRFGQEKQAFDTAWKKGKSPQSLEYDTAWKSTAKSPRGNPALQNDISWKESNRNDKSGSIGGMKQNKEMGISNKRGKMIENEGIESNQNYPAENIPVGSAQFILPPEGKDFDDEGGQLVERQHTFPNGDVYIGTWRGKWIEGYGVYNFSKQNLQYRGQFKKNKQHGAGVLLRKPGGSQSKQEEIYDGQWMNGEKHGLGKYYYFKDVYYDGNWVRNKKEGNGVFKSQEGEYRGEWKNDKKDGKGVLKLKNGHVFEGTWIMNEFLEGTLTHSNGDRYQGEFENFNRHGYGTYYYSNKSKYRGYWQNNQKHGTGEIQYFNGDTYQGPMNHNKRQGNDGTYRWQSGEEIVAEFQGDMPVRGKIRLPAEGESQFNLVKSA